MCNHLSVGMNIGPRRKLYQIPPLTDRFWRQILRVNEFVYKHKCIEETNIQFASLIFRHGSAINNHVKLLLLETLRKNCCTRLLMVCLLLSEFAPLSRCPFAVLHVIFCGLLKRKWPLCVLYLKSDKSLTASPDSLKVTVSASNLSKPRLVAYLVRRPTVI